LLLLRWQEARAEAWYRELELELEEVQQRLSSAEKLEAVGRLAGGVAHDFNNKLAVILGYAEALESETGHNPRLTEAVTAIRTAAENAAGVTAQLLAIGRRQYVRLQVVEFNEVLAGLAAGIQRTLGESVRLELVRSLRPTFGTVDTVWLERALGHLATNAREAMPQGGSFRMEVRTLDVSEAGVSRRPTLRSGRFVQIEIADNGPGVSSEAIPHLFEPFFSTKSTHEGRGLGLASVRGFVSQCGGFVTIDTAPGNGFACHLHFPRADGPLDKTSPPRTLDQK
jgi:signal transduction histidine kinase